MFHAPRRPMQAVLVIGPALALCAALWMGQQAPGTPAPIGVAAAASPVSADAPDTSVPSASTVGFSEQTSVDTVPTF